MTMPVIKVAFLGPIGSYTHQAALQQFDSIRFVLESRSTIKEVFEAVQLDHVHYGVVPFENSSNGPVLETLDLFSDRDEVLPDICVVGESHVEVAHCLLGWDDSLSPANGASMNDDPGDESVLSERLPDLSHIKHIYSHPQAFGQSRTFLNKHLKNAVEHEISSTSKGAEIVATSKDLYTASISSKIAAKLLGLKVLARGIQDQQANFTKFFTISRDNIYPVMKPCKSLVAFSIDHRKPGALADALGVFKTHGLNLTSIHSRPKRRAPWHYMFFIEFDDQVLTNGDHPGYQALLDLDEFAEERRWYGSWTVDMPPRSIGEQIQAEEGMPII